MRREFCLVLLGAILLAVGACVLPVADPARDAADRATAGESGPVMIYHPTGGRPFASKTPTGTTHDARRAAGLDP